MTTTTGWLWGIRALAGITPKVTTKLAARVGTGTFPANALVRVATITNRSMTMNVRSVVFSAIVPPASKSLSSADCLS
jgi:hypothetical protein